MAKRQTGPGYDVPASAKVQPAFFPRRPTGSPKKGSGGLSPVTVSEVRAAAQARRGPAVQTQKVQTQKSITKVSEVEQAIGSRTIQEFENAGFELSMGKGNTVLAKRDGRVQVIEPIHRQIIADVYPSTQVEANSFPERPRGSTVSGLSPVSLEEREKAQRNLMGEDVRFLTDEQQMNEPFVGPIESVVSFRKFSLPNIQKIGGELFGTQPKKQQEIFVGVPRGTISKDTSMESIGAKFQRNLDIESEKVRKQSASGEFGAEMKGVGIGAAMSVLSTGRFIYNVAEKPKDTMSQVLTSSTELGKDIISGKGIPNAGRFIMEKPGQAIGFVGTELATMKLSQGGIKRVGKLIEQETAMLSPKYKPVIDDMLSVKVKGGDIKDIKITQSYKDFTIPVSQQVGYAGKKIDAVTAQRSLFNLFERQKVVDKPLPTPSSPPLERSLFADPEARLRPSRLGITNQKDATMVDLLSGNVQLGGNKPQGFIFPDTTVAKIPKGLMDIEKALKGGKPLTKSQEARLVKFQMTPEGKFKPIGFLTNEPEVTLPPGEIVRKGKKVAVTLINGRKVKIYQADIVPATKRTEQLIGKQRKGKINLLEFEELSKRIERETGISRPKQRPRIIPPAVSGKVSGKRPSRNTMSRMLQGSSTVKAISRPTPSSTVKSRVKIPDYTPVPRRKIDISVPPYTPPRTPSRSPPPPSPPRRGPPSPPRREPPSPPLRTRTPPFPIPPPPPPKFKNTEFRKLFKKKKQKKFKRAARFNPQLATTIEKIIGRPPRVLTGIGVERPVPIERLMR